MKHIRFFVVVLMAAIVCLFSSVGLDADAFEKTYSENICNEVNEKAYTVTKDGSGTFCYDRLGETQQIVYGEIKAAVKAFTESDDFLNEDYSADNGKVHIDNTDTSYIVVMQAFTAFYLDNPQFYWISWCLYTENADGKDISRETCKEMDIIISDDFYKASFRKEANAVIEDTTKKWLSVLNQKSDRYEQVVTLHDLICDKIDYAYLPDNKTPDSSDKAHSIYGVLSGYGAVCMGYSSTFSYFLNMLGIENANITGSTDTGGGHAWNAVKFDGDYYLVDVTWNDDRGDYDYFCMPSSMFEMTHRQGVYPGEKYKNLDYFVKTEPYANNQDYQYYFHNESFIRANVTDDQLEEVIEAAMDNRMSNDVYFVSTSEDTLDMVHDYLSEWYEKILPYETFNSQYGIGFVYTPDDIELDEPVVDGEYVQDDEHSYMSAVRLKWAEVKNATSYRVYRSESADGVKKYIGRSDVSSFSDFHIRLDGYYYVTAYNVYSGEESRYSKPCKVDVDEGIQTYIGVEYSDLFYVYDSSYLDSAYYNAYSDEVFEMLNEINYDYVNSIFGIATELKTAIHAAVNWMDWCKIISDAYFGTSFNYNEALDAANAKFAQNIMSESWLNKASSELSSIAGKAKKVSDIFEKLQIKLNINTATTQEIYITFLDDLYDSNCLSHISKSSVKDLKKIDLSKYISKGLSHGAEALEVVQAISTGMLLEELRMEMIDRMISSSESGSALKQGMTRLKSQLVNGFASYFAENYIKDKVIDTLIEGVVEYFISGSFLKVKSWITFVVDIVNEIIFFKTPDLEDLLVQRVLTEYSNDLHTILAKQRGKFDKQFDVKEVEMLSLLYSAYAAVNNAALEHSKQFALSSNKKQLQILISKYGDMSYEDYIESVVHEIWTKSPNSRKTKTYEKWTVSGTGVEFSLPSDVIEANKIYTDRMGWFNCDNLTISSTMTVPEGGDFAVTGDVYVFSSHLYNNGKFEVEGNMKGNVIGYYHQDKEDAEFIIGGNLEFDSLNRCQITAGTVIFDGTEQQTVTYLKAYNVEVLNSAGIKYLSNVYVYGNYDLHGNPLENGDFRTLLYDGAIFADGSNYQDLEVGGKEFTLRSNLPCNSVTINYGYTLNVLEDDSWEITGNVVVKGKLIMNEILEIHLNMNVLEEKVGVYNYIYGSYEQDSEEAQLIVGGNLSFSSSNYCYITAGTVIFNGTEQQTVGGLKAYNVEVRNSKGIKYSRSIFVYGNYDLHGNPLDENGYKTVFKEDGAFGTLAKNRSDWIVDKQPTCGTPGSRHIECKICHEILETEEIPVNENNHCWDEGKITKHPTHMHDGEKLVTCIYCGTTSTEIIPRTTQHTFDCQIASDKYLANKADCEHSATYYYSCECGEKGDKTFAFGEPSGHKWGEYISNNDATQNTDGTKTATCSECGEKHTMIDKGSATGDSGMITITDGGCGGKGEKNSIYIILPAIILMALLLLKKKRM